MRTLDELIAQAPVFAGLDADALTLIAGCARNVGFEEQELLFRDGEPADTFYVVRRGRVALELHTPEPGGLVIETARPDAFYARVTDLAASRQCGLIDEITSPDDNLQAVFAYLVKS